MHSQSEELFNLICSKLLQYKQRKRFFNEQSLGKDRERYQSFVGSANLSNELQKETLLFDQAIVEFDQIFCFLTQIHRQDSSKICQLSTMLEIKCLAIEDVQEKLSGKQKQKQQLEDTNRQISEQLSMYKKAYEQVVKQHEKYKNESFDAFGQQNIRIGTQLKEIAQLKQEISGLKKSISSRSEQIQMLSAKIQLIEASLKQKSQEISKLEMRLASDFQRRKKLESIIRDKQELICQLEEEIISHNKIAKNPFTDYNFNIEMFSPPENDGSDTESKNDLKNKVKLSDEIENKPFQYRHQIQLTCLDRINDPDDNLIGKELDQVLQKTLSSTPTKIFTKIKKPIVLDPYYCHYVLLSQTIKILQNEEDFFNVDVKPLYKQMISEKVPMFEWREWIVKKMKQICGKN